uniref:Nucleotide-diphospho-sugar transferase domain-containing protein n=1 Tax=viral metagenome TaxID=1070528 RepID=A0A6C0DR36_9ZZZZ
MRIVCMTNDAQLPMMKNMLNSALKCGFPMHMFHCFILSSDKEVATYNTEQFKSITTRKLEVILLNMGMDIMLWVDNDIVFFENCLKDIVSKSGSFVMQDDGWGYCTGFFLARPGIFANQIIQKSISWLKQRQGALNDQHAFNAVAKQSPVSIFKLSNEEYPNGEVYFEKKIQSKARMVHSNYLMTTSEKVQRFKDHGMWDESDAGFNVVNKYFI